MKVANKVFVVTGAAGGIGGALVRQLLESGSRVAAVDLSQDSLEQLKSELGSPVQLSWHAIDITNRRAVADLPAQVTKAHSQIDGLINCAGIIQPFVKIADLEYEAIERVMNVNFYGTLYFVKTFLPVLLDRPEAHIVNVSSMGGFLPVPGQSVYGASKAAVKLLSEGLFAELIDTNVGVSVVFPGATDTDITKNSGLAEPNDGPSADSSVAAKMISPDQAAQAIVRGIEQNRPQIYTGQDSKTMNRLYRLNPIFATKLIARQMRSLLG